uniref:Olfactory receptor 6M1-like n=1 Tax=Geotrypetes seraphini TaxID=260995 RepID=A0A6P8NS82_GEOSA|nr:olfactory receptor 6M1-like [Geotrypetes seraphini]
MEVIEAGDTENLQAVDEETPMDLQGSLPEEFLQYPEPMKMEVITDLEVGNKSRVTEFILIGFGFPVTPFLRIISFILLFLVYILTLTGNILIIALIGTNSHLHTPMYFFLSNLSFLEIWFITSIVPKMMMDTLSERKSISIAACFSQTYFYFFLGTAEFILLAVMSIDRYVAICLPLRYGTILNSRVCLGLVIFCWGGSFVIITFPAIFFFQLSFCGPNIMDHFFCDLAPLLELACSDTRPLKWVNFISASFTLLGSLLITLFSYICIISTILQIPSTGGRRKAFSTCASHLIVVVLIYGSCIFMYVIPSIGVNKMVAILNTVVTPLLNPFIYTLRNEKVKQIMKDTIGRVVVFAGDLMHGGLSLINGYVFPYDDVKAGSWNTYIAILDQFWYKESFAERYKINRKNKCFK